MASGLVRIAFVSALLNIACSDDEGRSGPGSAGASGDGASGGHSGAASGASGSENGGGSSTAGASGGGGDAGGAAGGSGTAGSVASAGSAGGMPCPQVSPAETPSVCGQAQQGKVCRYGDACFFCGCVPQQAEMYCVYGSGECPRQ